MTKKMKPERQKKPKKAAIDDDLGKLQVDALQEIGNIAGAHVATTLSEIVGERIMVDFSESNAFPPVI
jgi:chemotaxis protein CheY-P-specific phosphatase CheC